MTPPRAPRPPIGAHVPVARGGLVRGGLAYADRVDAEAVQVFVSNPRGWAQPALDLAVVETFRAAATERALPVFVHAPYLVNLGSPSLKIVERSAAALRHSLERATLIGAQGVVVHTGSAVAPGPNARAAALAQIRQQLLMLLDALRPGAPRLLLEATAGQGHSVCSTIDELGHFLAMLDGDPRIGVCFDTCHAFAAGHDLAVRGGMTRTLDSLVDAIGVDRLQLVHANDAKDGVGSLHDRHENIGAGCIGSSAFGALLRHPAVRDVPVVVETPGGEAGHAADIAVLKKLRRR